MAFTVNGVGTTFYGKRDYHPDASYITTQWVVFCFLPVLPLRSLRVRPTDSQSDYILSTHHYEVLKKRCPSWKQVLYTYSYVALLFGGPPLIGLIAQSYHSVLIELSLPFWVALLCLLPYLLRRRARHANYRAVRGVQSLADRLAGSRYHVSPPLDVKWTNLPTRGPRDRKPLKSEENDA